MTENEVTDRGLFSATKGEPAFGVNGADGRPQERTRVTTRHAMGDAGLYYAEHTAAAGACRIEGGTGSL